MRFHSHILFAVLAKQNSGRRGVSFIVIKRAQKRGSALYISAVFCFGGLTAPRKGGANSASPMSMLAPTSMHAASPPLTSPLTSAVCVVVKLTPSPTTGGSRRHRLPWRRQRHRAHDSDRSKAIAGVDAYRLTSTVTDTDINVLDCVTKVGATRSPQPRHGGFHSDTNGTQLLTATRADPIL